MNRRSFVSSVAAASALAATASRLRAADAKSARRPTLGVIGSGWYGGVNLKVFARCTDVEVTALCDVNTQNLTKTLALVAELQSTVPQTFVDYRDLLATAAPDIVIIATPDH